MRGEIKSSGEKEEKKGEGKGKIKGMEKKKGNKEWRKLWRVQPVVLIPTFTKNKQ